MLVADSDQFIYRFAGASDKWLEAFMTDFDAQRHNLIENFRCAEAVIDAANSLVKHKPKAVSRVVMAPAKPAPGSVQAFCYPNEDAEAEGVARWVQHLLRDGLDPTTLYGSESPTVAPSDICVLCRNRYALGAITEKLENAVAAVIEVKSDLTKQDEEARKTLGAVRKLKLFHLHDELLQSALAAESLAEAFRRPLDPKAQAFLAKQGIAPPDTESEVEEFRGRADKYRAAARQQASRSRIPTFLVGFRGWKDFDSYRDKSALNADVALSLEPLVFTHHLWGQDTTRPICITRVQGAPALFHFLEALRVQIWHRAAMPTMTETYA